MEKKEDLTTYSISLPIFILNDNGGKRIIGTCFPIGKDFFLTAGHVAEDLDGIAKQSKDSYIVLLSEPDHSKINVKIKNVECLDADIGLIEVEQLNEHQKNLIFPLHWSLKNNNLGMPVKALGYGHSDYDETDYIIHRSFQGNIVSYINSYVPLGMTCNPFPIYELSFAAPIGHSGSPLLSAEKGRVMGVFIGNGKSEMSIFSETEKIVDENKTTVYGKVETMSLGIAVQPAGILNQESKILNMKIGDFLNQEKLIHSD